jgi:phage baseplate assembly protein W
MKAIKHPFHLDSFGKITSTSDQNKIYLDRLLSLLSTMVYQRPMRSLYGTDIFRALYETGDDYIQAVRESITRAVSTYLPILTIVNIDIKDSDTEGKSTVEITVSFPDNTIDSVQINTLFLSNDGTIAGEIR